jgi:hypothetical protein
MRTDGALVSAVAPWHGAFDPPGTLDWDLLARAQRGGLKIYKVKIEDVNV